MREKDKGPNTGGMGAYSPALIINKKVEYKIINKIVKPTLRYLKQNKNPYVGFLYIGLMIRNGEPYLIEFNVRMGDPECQVIIPRLKTDIVKVFRNTVSNKLKNTNISWQKQKCMTIVLCSKGYPGNYEKNKVIKNLEKLKLNNNDFVYHAGTKINNGVTFSNGGRVLNITSKGSNLKKLEKK